MFCLRQQREITEPECWGVILGTPKGDDLKPCIVCDYGRGLAESCPYNKRKAAALPAQDDVTKAKLKAMLDLLEAYNMAEEHKIDEESLL